jgi:hypothetical protein
VTNTFGRAVAVAIPTTLAVASMIVLGVVLQWPLWFRLSAAAVAIVLVAHVISAIAVLHRSADEPPRWVIATTLAVVLLMAAISVGAATTMYTSWTVADAVDATDAEDAATAAYTIAGPLTAITPQTREQYLPQLRPLMTQELADAFETKFLNPMPADTPTRVSTVRSISVEAVADGAASVIAVVKQTPPDPSRDEPSDAIWWLLLGRYEGKWYLANLAPLIG